MSVLTHWDGEPVQVWERLWQAPLVEIHDELGSTNDRARALAGEGAPPFTVVLAEAQSAGRGRSGDVWHSPSGEGLWLSALLPAVEPVPTHLPLLVGLAAARAAETVCPGTSVGLKWPNDLEVRGRKAGGILCEHGHGFVVAGVGINVSQKEEDFPAALGGRATSLEAASGRRVSLGRLSTALLAELRTLCAAPPRHLTGEVHGELLRRDVLLGRAVTTQQAGEGTARGIEADGALVLERAGGERVRVVAGSVRAR
jgi:BirA family biotin operon repressor/biotin-[acetyl-CoA-carboxylase] ligase